MIHAETVKCYMDSAYEILYCAHLKKNENGAVLTGQNIPRGYQF